jgi:hypothetical protein
MIDKLARPKIKELVKLPSGLQMSGLALALARLDRRIEYALNMLPTIIGSEAGRDQIRGMHISPQDVAVMLGREPGAPLFKGVLHICYIVIGDRKEQYYVLINKCRQRFAGERAKAQAAKRGGILQHHIRYQSIQLGRRSGVGY